MFHNAANDYLKATTLEPIIVPPNLDDRAVGQILKIPETGVLIAGEESIVPPPPRLTVKKDIPKVSIQQLGDKRWILMAQSPAETWPLILDFLNANQLMVANSDVSKGILETDWLTLSIDPENINKYRLRVDSGVQPDTTEIHIVNLVHPKNQIEQPIPWPQASTDTTRENWMINELVETLTNKGEAVSGESLLAQSVGSGDKAYLRQQQNELVLAIVLDKQRAYASLSYALKQDEFILYEQDPARGIFYIDYPQITDEKKSSGSPLHWLAKLNPFTSNKRSTSRYALNDVIDHLPAQAPQVKDLFYYQNGKSDTIELDDVPGYLVVIVDDDFQQLVYIRDGYGGPLPLSKSKRLLTLIRRQLI